jgi:hypothetical protein
MDGFGDKTQNVKASLMEECPNSMRYHQIYA